MHLLVYSVFTSISSGIATVLYTLSVVSAGTILKNIVKMRLFIYICFVLCQCVAGGNMIT